MGPLWVIKYEQEVNVAYLILHLHEGEARRPPGHPDVPDWTELTEGILEVVPREVRTIEK